jgi:hypothetical protein
VAQNTTKNPRLPRTFMVQGSITRPSGNTTQYTAGDAISDNATTPTSAGYFSFDAGLAAGMSFRLTDFTLHKSDSDLTTPDIGLMLFSTRPALAGFEDNVALAITDAEMKECQGTLVFSTYRTIGTGDISTVSQNLGFVLAPTDTIMYGLLYAVGGYTPADGEVYTVTIHGVHE